MPKAIALNWNQLVAENSGIEDRLARLFENGPATECHNYIRQRRREPELTHRARINYKNGGLAHETAVYRLVFVRAYGSVAEGLHVAHLCAGNGNCGNPHHLVAMSPGAHRKFDATQRAWVRAVKAQFPNAIGYYDSITGDRVYEEDGSGEPIAAEPAQVDGLDEVPPESSEIAGETRKK